MKLAALILFLAALLAGGCSLLTLPGLVVGLFDAEVREAPAELLLYVGMIVGGFVVLVVAVP